MSPALGRHDRQLLRTASRLIGVDEVGRGALAGPVVVAAAAFDRVPRQAAVQDSKVVARRRREQAAAWVRANADGWGVVEIWVELVDRLNILEATRSAMCALARSLARPGDLVVVDGVELELDGVEVLTRTRADSTFFAVAAASLVAKVHRDRLMADLARRHQAWGWERNVGYPSPAHRLAIARVGRSFLHRSSFRCSPPAIPR